MGFIGLILFTMLIIVIGFVRWVYYAVKAFFTEYKITIQPREEHRYIPAVQM